MFDGGAKNQSQPRRWGIGMGQKSCGLGPYFWVSVREEILGIWSLREVV